MATTLIDSLQGMVTPQLLATASSRLGEPESAVSKGRRDDSATAASRC